MRIKEYIEKLHNSKEFKEWRKDNKNSYLVHLFFMSEQPTQIGYYDSKKDVITTFDINTSITVNPESSVFKKSGEIHPLEIEKIKLDLDKAMEISSSFQKEKYSKEILMKNIIILQNMGNVNIYNITYVTMGFKTLNIKINAENSEIISHELRSIMELAGELNENPNFKG